MAGDRASDSREPRLSGSLDEELREAVKSDRALAYLVLFVGDQPQRIHTIRTNSILLGRVDDAQVCIADASVSSHHARIVGTNQAFEIIDLDSTNGTFVNGKRVSRSPLRNADELTVGNVGFMFLLDRPTTATIRLPDRIGRMPPKRTEALVPTIVAPSSMESVPPQEEEAGPSLADMLRKAAGAYAFVRDRSLFIGALGLLGVALGVLSLFVVPPGVSASSEVKLMPHMTLSSSPNEDPWQNSERESGQFVKGAERSLTQPDAVRATLQKLSPQVLPEARVLSVAGHLKVEETGDHMFRVTYKDKANAQPQPQEFLALLLRNYVQSEIARSLRELSAKVNFLHDQLASVEGDVQRVSGERESYREENSDRLPEDASQTHSSRFDLESRRTELSSQLHQLEGELAAAEDQLKANAPEAQRRFQRSESYRQALTDVNRKLSEAYSRGLGESHPEVQALKEEKQRLEVLAKDELQSSSSTLARESDPNYQLAKVNVEKLRAQIGATRTNLGETASSLGQVRRVVRDLPRVEQHLADLDHRQEATMQFHAELFSKLKQAEIQLNLEKVSAESRYETSPPHLERSRNRSTLATRGGLGLLLGIFVAALGIALGEARRIIKAALSPQVLPAPNVLARRDSPRSRRF
jgi:hypothetical protein